MPTINKHFNNRLREVIETSKFTQKKLSELSGISETTISRWKHPNAPKPDPKSLKAISEATGCDLEWLATGKGEPFPNSTDQQPTHHITKGSATVTATHVSGTTINNENRRHAGPQCEGLCKKLTPLQKNAIQIAIDMGTDDDWKSLIQRILDRVGQDE